MEVATREQATKRLHYIEGHLAGIRHMIEEETTCIAILQQTYAVRCAIEKVEAVLLADHLRTDLLQLVRTEQPEGLVTELVDLYVRRRRRRTPLGSQRPASDEGSE